MLAMAGDLIIELYKNPKKIKYVILAILIMNIVPILFTNVDFQNDTFNEKQFIEELPRALNPFMFFENLIDTIESFEKNNLNFKQRSYKSKEIDTGQRIKSLNGK